MKERLTYIAIIIGLVAGLTYLLYNPAPSYVKEYEEKIEELSFHIDSLKEVNHRLDLQAKEFSSTIDSLDSKLVEYDSSIVNLKQQLNENVTAIDTFNTNELYRFFTDRYRQYFDSSP